MAGDIWQKIAHRAGTESAGQMWYDCGMVSTSTVARSTWWIVKCIHWCVRNWNPPQWDVPVRCDHSSHCSPVNETGNECIADSGKDSISVTFTDFWPYFDDILSPRVTYACEEHYLRFSI